MSRPKAKSADAGTARKPYDTNHISEASSLEEIIKARAEIERELMRRSAYEALLKRRQQLAETPPIPGSVPDEN